MGSLALLWLIGFIANQQFFFVDLYHLGAAARFDFFLFQAGYLVIVFEFFAFHLFLPGKYVPRPRVFVPVTSLCSGFTISTSQPASQSKACAVVTVLPIRCQAFCKMERIVAPFDLL
jgi:hypothetical protein